MSSMQVLTVDKLLKQKEPFAAAIGFFDGVHLGHQKVIGRAVDYAKANDFKSLVITFDRSPKGLNDGVITTLDAKLQLLTELGVDYVLVLEFNDLLKQLSAADFVRNYLLQLGVRYVSVGFDFRFGHQGVGDALYLQKWEELTVDICEAELIDGVKIGSTEIKKSLKDGDLAGVKAMLGRAFSVVGTVVHGKKLGRTIGFPTVNLQLDAGQFLGVRGVFVTRVYLDGKEYSSMTNVGYNPTANLQQILRVETHIFDFDADIYGAQLQLEFLAKIRDEIKFASVDELVAQLEKDKKIAEKTH